MITKSFLQRFIYTAGRKVSAFGLGAFLSMLSTPRFAFADCSDPNYLCNPIKYRNLTEFLLAIVSVVIQYGAVLIVFFIVYAGFKFVTAQGNSEKVSEARKMLTWVVIGSFVLLGVYVIRAAICGTIGELGVTVDCSIQGASE